MTVQEAISIGQELLLETSDSAAAASPRAWLYLLRQALNEVGQAADAWQYTYETDLITGINLYCAPPLYKIVGAQALDINGTRYGIRSVSYSTLRERIDPDADPAQFVGCPQLYAAAGANRILVWPTPNYSTAGVPASVVAGVTVPASGYGLILEGYAKPGDVWIQAPGALTDLTTQCPLDSENAQMAAVYRAMSLRCKQFGKLDAAAVWEQDYKYAKGMYESEIATKNSANRQRMQEKVGPGINGGPLPSNLGFDPLGRW